MVEPMNDATPDMANASAARPFLTPGFPLPNVLVLCAGVFMVVSLAIKKGLPSLAAFAFIVSAFPVHYFLVRPYKRRLLARGVRVDRPALVDGPEADDGGDVAEGGVAGPL